MYLSPFMYHSKHVCSTLVFLLVSIPITLYYSCYIFHDSCEITGLVRQFMKFTKYVYVGTRVIIYLEEIIDIFLLFF